jgi:hypothetical protein
MPRTALTLAFAALLAAGCGAPDASGDDPSGDPASGAAASGAPDSLLLYPGEITLTNPGSVTDVTTREATLETVVPTDDGCFVMVAVDEAQELLMATPEACAMATPLEGQAVTLEQGDSAVEARGCEGPGCPEGGTTRLVVAVAAAE